MHPEIGLDVAARWYAGKDRALAGASPIGSAGGLALVQARYADGGTDSYLDVRAGFAWGDLFASLARGAVAGEGGRLEVRPAAGTERRCSTASWRLASRCPRSTRRTRWSSSVGGCS